MQRRQFLAAAVAGAMALPLSPLSPLVSRARAATSGWRTFEIVTTVTLDASVGADAARRVWLPLPLSEATDYQRTLNSRWETNGSARVERDARYDTPILSIEWPANLRQTPFLKAVSQVETRDRHIELDAAGRGRRSKLAPAARALWLQPTELLPTDGIVLETSQRILRDITAGADDIARARAIYDWVIERTFRDPQTPGCGVGDVRYMLEANALGGKCADISAVFVALARAAGIPARDVYGIRVAPSARGYRSLGKSGGDIARAQHCRAEFHADGYGWVPVDPADVRKLMLEEEKGGLPADDPRVAAIHAHLFGNWEMNWIAYNHGHDLALPGSPLGEAGRVGFLMYPQGETADGRLDPLDPEHFRYAIVARALS